MKLLVEIRRILFKVEIKVGINSYFSAFYIVSKLTQDLTYVINTSTASHIKNHIYMKMIFVLLVF